MAKSQELRAKRAKIITDAQALSGADDFNAEKQAQFDAMMAEANLLMEQITRIEHADDLAARNAESIRAAAVATGASVGETEERRQLEEATFQAWMRGGVLALNDEQRAIHAQRFQAAQSVGTPSGGGYTVPQGFYDRLIDAQRAYGGMLEAGFLIETDAGNDIPVPTDNDTASVGALLGENTQATTQDVTFGSVTLNAYTYTSKIVLVSNQLLQDSAFDLDTFLAEKLGIRIARITNTHFTTGTGTGQPNGAVTGATAGFTLPAGNTTSITFAGLTELQHSVDPEYRRNGRFMLSDTMLKKIKQLVDGQSRPLWLPGLAVKEPDTILGQPYIINQDIAVPAANAKSMLYGDFTNYFIRRVRGATVMRLVERYADFNQTGFVAFQRWDGKLIDAGTNPIKYLAQSAT